MLISAPVHPSGDALHGLVSSIRGGHTLLRSVFARKYLLGIGAVVLFGCDRGMSECEKATRAALPSASVYERARAVEEPGETPAMTYFVIDYFVTDRNGQRTLEQVHCAYMRDFGEATVHRITSTPAD